MHHQEFFPPQELRNAVKCFWYDKRDYGKAGSGYEVVPDGYAEVIFYFGSSVSIADKGLLQPLISPFLLGLQQQPVNFYGKGCVEIVAVRCYPWAVFNLLGLPPGKNKVGAIETSVAGLQARLKPYIDNGDINGAVNVLAQHFLLSLPQVPANSTLYKAGAALSGANGNLPVSRVAAAAHATVRTLERKFRQSSGYTVKDVSGLMRFEQARNHLWLYPGCSLAGLAHELGYTDQAHLSREFKRYSGTTPAAFARNAAKDKPALASGPVTLVQD